MTITSPAFGNERDIPIKYTCDGEDVNPPLHIDGIPGNTVTIALIVEDPDALNGTFNHWVVWNIDPIANIEEDSLPGVSGRNSFGKTGYRGPCPPTGIHRYYFYVFALDIAIDLPEGADRESLRSAMEGHVIGHGNIMGRYGKKSASL